MRSKDIRYKNVRWIIDTLCSGRLKEFASRIGKVETHASQFAGEGRSKGIGDDMAILIEKKFDLPDGWLDRLHQEGNEVADELKLFIDSVPESRRDAALQAAKQVLLAYGATAESQQKR